MRIIHIISDLTDGGAEGVLYRLTKVTNNIEHVIVSLKGRGKYGSLLEDNGIKVYNLKFYRWFQFFHVALRLACIIYSEKPQLVQTWMYHADLIGGVIARLCGIKNVVWNVRSPLPKFGTKTSKNFYLCLLLSFLSNFIPKNIIFCSKKSLTDHIKFGYKKKLCVYLANGYPKQPFKNKVVDKSAFEIGCVGRLDVYKDYPNLFSSLRILKEKEIEFSCRIIGRGISLDDANLSNLLDELDLHDQVELCGPSNDAIGFMTSCDLLVLSSSEEAFPNVVAEAMSCGVPCVVTDAGDAREIVGDTGWVCNPKDPDDLALAIMSAMRAKECGNWTKIRMAAMQRISDHYSIEKMCELYVNIWFSTLGVR